MWNGSEMVVDQRCAKLILQPLSEMLLGENAFQQPVCITSNNYVLLCDIMNEIVG